MRYLKWCFVLCLLTSVLDAVQIEKSGLIPHYPPYLLKHAQHFLPYNPTILVVGEKMTDYVLEITQEYECSTLYCCTPLSQEFETLEAYRQHHPKLFAKLGIIGEGSNPQTLYYSVLDQAQDDSLVYIPGSLLKPVSTSKPDLLGPKSLLPSYSLSQLCQEQGASKVHFLCLNSGGNELAILQTTPAIVNQAIVIRVKTYHRPLRRHQTDFRQLHEYMRSQGYELLSHYIYDHTIGDALYVKNHYLNAVFRSKKL